MTKRLPAAALFLALFAVLALPVFDSASVSGLYFNAQVRSGVYGAGAASSEAGELAIRAEYEAAVKGLADKAAAMRAAGASSEDIARVLSAARNALKVEYRALSPAEEVAKFEARNLARYGDKVGPSIEYLRESGKSWEDIIEAACRPGGHDLGF